MDTIGFVGLEHMGGNMAARFLDAGYDVYGTARSREGAERFVDMGVRWVDTPRAIAFRSGGGNATRLKATLSQYD
jgi:3-hydroxyisobutyrate dehydrogenase-like beta-hydroxyacid dehydrogenase